MILPANQRKGRTTGINHMNLRSASLYIGCTIVFFALNLPCSFAAPAAKPEDDGWVSLFNGKNFDGWYTYLDASGKNKDPKGVFKVENGMIHIEDFPKVDGSFDNGYLSTTQDISNVRIHVEYKWGPKRHSEHKRNSGLLYLAVGADTIYPTSIECQIEESDVGDMWLVNGAASTAFFIAPTVPIFDDDMGTGTSLRSNFGQSLRVLKSGDFEDRDNWNTVEVILDGDRSTQIVNGRIVNRANDIQQPDPNNPAHMIPLKSGRILLEAEDGSEIWFRNLKVKPLARTQKP
jgi:hypothetical protein